MWMRFDSSSRQPDATATALTSWMPPGTHGHSRHSMLNASRSPSTRRPPRRLSLTGELLTLTAAPLEAAAAAGPRPLRRAVGAPPTA